MNDIIVKIVAGVLSSFGFAILFRLKPSRWIYASLDGLVACVLYFAFIDLFDTPLLPNAVAAFGAAIFADIFARIAKAPATVFLLPGCIALVPGGTLYYTMSNLLAENNEAAVECFLTTLSVGIGIGGGVIAASLLRYIVLSIMKKINNRKIN